MHTPPLTHNLTPLQAHLRAVLGWPLGDCGLRVGAAIMLNILGEVGTCLPSRNSAACRRR